jgi:hypothetical protein
MRHGKRAHRIFVLDGDQAHFEQGLDILQVTLVRIVHPDGDCALVWEESTGERSGSACKWIVPVLWPAQRARVSGEKRNSCIETNKVFFFKLWPIQASVKAWNVIIEE